ncbi:hypothetical protein [Streptomyces sp. Root369]|uniref:hypothetical protein n=1 Tax=Streptomyces sp. Root369 TaxID=1736523 RepID=UPI00070942B9|nr:hypothetical protein [Streptomyces sp. Root369]KQV94302.1 hypothetical protein ASD08_14920 [Streptomyces sp. Root369]
MNLSVSARPAVRGVLVSVGATLLLTTLASCSDDEETLESWSEKGGQKHMTAIAKDVTTLIEVSDPIGSDPTVASQCSQVLDDVKAARGYGAVPDDIAQTRWKEALDRLDTAASRCVRNAKSGKAGTSLTEVMDVQSAFHGFAQRIENLRSKP